MSELPVELLASSLAAPEVEVYHKRGRSRRLTWAAEGKTLQTAVEEGWAVRAGGATASGFWCGTGSPPRELGAETQVCARGGSLSLPSPRGAAGDGLLGSRPVAASSSAWDPPTGIGSPLGSEGTLGTLVDEVRQRLARELPGAALARAVLDDGASSSALANTHGVDVRWQNRVALLHLEAHRGMDAAVLDVAARRAVDLEPMSLGRRLADLLVSRRRRGSLDTDTEVTVLAPAVGRRILAGLRPLWCGERATSHAEALAGTDGRLGAAVLDIVDDGRLPDGLLSAPVDGEGVPTGEQTIVETGRYVAPLASWRDRPGALGCMRRSSWRMPPTLSPSHLFIRPGERRATELVSEVVRGLYLLAAVGGGEFDLREDRFELPISGFVIADGEASAPIGEAALSGTIGGLLRGVEAVGRDLRFGSRDAVYGAPTLLVSGLTVTVRRD